MAPSLDDGVISTKDLAYARRAKALGEVLAAELLPGLWRARPNRGVRFNSPQPPGKHRALGGRGGRRQAAQGVVVSHQGVAAGQSEDRAGVVQQERGVEVPGAELRGPLPSRGLHEPQQSPTLKGRRRGVQLGARDAAILGEQGLGEAVQERVVFCEQGRAAGQTQRRARPDGL